MDGTVLIGNGDQHQRAMASGLASSIWSMRELLKRESSNEGDHTPDLR